jgi:hypothetical protein
MAKVNKNFRQNYKKNCIWTSISKVESVFGVNVVSCCMSTTLYMFSHRQVFFRTHLCSSSSALFDENTISRDGSCSIHSTLDTGRQEKRNVDGCMWKYTMTSTGKEAYT